MFACRLLRVCFSAVDVMFLDRLRRYAKMHPRVQSVVLDRFTLTGARDAFSMRGSLAFVVATAAVAKITVGGNGGALSLCDGKIQDKDLQAVRGVLHMLRTKAGIDPEQFLLNTEAAYVAVAKPDGTLTRLELDQAVRARNAKIQHGKWLRVARPEALSEIGPLLFRLLDVNRDGKVTLTEFVFGQALIYGAAKANGRAELDELCWRLLDVDGNGTVDRLELREAVRTMVLFDCVNVRDKRYRTGDFRVDVGTKRVREIKRERNVDQLVDYYMDMYDTNRDGKISRAEYSRCTALQENLLNLLTDHEASSLFLAEGSC